MTLWRHLRAVLATRAALATSIAVGLGYLGIYLFSIGDVVYSRDLWVLEAPSVDVVSGWASRLFDRRAPFSYEPIAAVYLTERFVFFVSPMNLLLGVVLAILLSLNVAVLVFVLRAPKACSARTSRSGLLAALPALFLGFACCAPTILLALGTVAASVTLGFLAVRSFLYPVALVGMLIGLLFNLRRIRPELA